MMHCFDFSVNLALLSFPVLKTEISVGSFFATESTFTTLTLSCREFCVRICISMNILTLADIISDSRSSHVSLCP
eukprot:m.93932 g.93932  ORF g.93932 m.93932 type:complete len:75 (+) comp36807_c0_seq14:1924-2148(+)